MNGLFSSGAGARLLVGKIARLSSCPRSIVVTRNVNNVAKAVTASLPLGGEISTIHPLGSSIIQKKFGGATATTSSRLFSSSATEELSDILSKELAEEIDSGNTEMPTELADLKQTLEEDDWKIVDDGAFTRLFRTSGGKKFTIGFHCQDSVDDPDADYDDDEDGEEYAPSFRFVVTSTKAGKTLVMNCMTGSTPDGGLASVESLAVTTDDIETVQANSGVNTKQYQGPEFIELDEMLQDSFHAYLEEEVGINQDLAAFISMYADYKEQSEYVQFLKDVKIVVT